MSLDVQNINSHLGYVAPNISFKSNSAAVEVDEPKNKSNTGKKVAIGTALTALAGIGIYLVTKGRKGKMPSAQQLLDRFAPDTNNRINVDTIFNALEYEMSDFGDPLAKFCKGNPDRFASSKSIAKHMVKVFADKVSNGTADLKSAQSLIEGLEHFCGKKAAKTILGYLH